MYFDYSKKLSRMRMSSWALLSAYSVAGLAQGNRPNVILILADDLGYGDLSCYGAHRVSTPAVDRLAQRGVLFTDAHAAASTSTPSRYGLLTGSLPCRKPNTNVAQGNAGMIISPDQFTLADVFHSQGYATAAIGKWHLGLGSTTAQQDWNAQLDQHPGDLGFDYSYIMAATADRVPCVFIEDGHVVNYDSSAPIEVSYQKRFSDVPTYHETPVEELKQRSSHGHDYAVVNGIGRIGWMKGGGKALWKDENLADSILAHALGFMDQHRDEPFFMYLATNDVHVPRYPNDRFRGKSPMGVRGDVIMQFDWTVDQVMRHLEELGIEDNTLIILTSDNGPILDDGYDDRSEELVGDHRPGGIYRGAKYSAYEAGNIVPFIVSWPGHVPQGKRSEAMVNQMDFVASMAQLVGADIPQGQAPDSHSSLKTWMGKSKKSAPYCITMAQNRSLHIRSKRWKYIKPCDGPAMIQWGPKVETGYKKTPQLFDMKKDPGETINVADKYPKIVQRMEDVLAATIGK